MLLPSGKEYVAFLKAVLRDDKIDEALLNFSTPKVPGRSAKATRLAKWYLSLKPQDRVMFKQAIKDVLDRAISTWLRVLDIGLGDDREYGRLMLYSTRGPEKQLINNPKRMRLTSLYYSAGYLDAEGKFHKGKLRNRNRRSNSGRNEG